MLLLTSSREWSVSKDHSRSAFWFIVVHSYPCHEVSNFTVPFNHFIFQQMVFDLTSLKAQHSLGHISWSYFLGSWKTYIDFPCWMKGANRSWKFHVSTVIHGAWRWVVFTEQCLGKCLEEHSDVVRSCLGTSPWPALSWRLLDFVLCFLCFYILTCYKIRVVVSRNGRRPECHVSYSSI